MYKKDKTKSWLRSYIINIWDSWRVDNILLTSQIVEHRIRIFSFRNPLCLTFDIIKSLRHKPTPLKPIALMDTRSNLDGYYYTCV